LVRSEWDVRFMRSRVLDLRSPSDFGMRSGCSFVGLVELRKTKLCVLEGTVNSIWFRKMFLVSVLIGTFLAVGCGSSAEGKYRDPTGSIVAEFKDGKAYIALGAYAVDGTYKIEGDKIIATGKFGLMLPSPCVFTINKDGTIDGPRDSMIPRLEKVK